MNVEAAKLAMNVQVSTKSAMDVEGQGYIKATTEQASGGTYPLQRATKATMRYLIAN